MRRVLAALTIATRPPDACGRRRRVVVAARVRCDAGPIPRRCSTPPTRRRRCGRSARHGPLRGAVGERCAGAAARGGARCRRCWSRRRSRPRTAVLLAPRRRSVGDGPRRAPQPRRGPRRRRRLDDHAAGREAAAAAARRGASRAGLREAARDGARDPARASLHQARDPRALPESGVVRQPDRRRGAREPALLRRRARRC